MKELEEILIENVFPYCPTLKEVSVEKTGENYPLYIVEYFYNNSITKAEYLRAKNLTEEIFVSLFKPPVHFAVRIIEKLLTPEEIREMYKKTLQAVKKIVEQNILEEYPQLKRYRVGVLSNDMTKIVIVFVIDNHKLLDWKTRDEIRDDIQSFYSLIPNKLGNKVTVNFQEG